MNMAKMVFEEKSYKEAFLALEKYNEYNAQIFEKERLNEIEAASVRFDVRQYQKDLEMAESKQLYQDQVI